MTKLVVLVLLVPMLVAAQNAPTFDAASVKRSTSGRAASRGRIEVLIIDHIERPSEN
jgi:hypothetical protein